MSIIIMYCYILTAINKLINYYQKFIQSDAPFIHGTIAHILMSPRVGQTKSMHKQKNQTAKKQESGDASTGRTTRLGL